MDKIWDRKSFEVGGHRLEAFLQISQWANFHRLTSAHLISQTSLRSNLRCSPITSLPSGSVILVSSSKKVSTPLMSMMANRLQATCHVICRLTNQNTLFTSHINTYQHMINLSLDRKQRDKSLIVLPQNRNILWRFKLTTIYI